jgi:hypothetical protein
MKLKGKNRDELKALIKEALMEALMELVSEGVLEVKVSEKLAEQPSVETEPTEPPSSTLNETEPTTLIETETIKVEPAEPAPTTLNVTEPTTLIETKPTTLIETETIKVEPAEPAPTTLNVTKPTTLIETEAEPATEPVFTTLNVTETITVPIETVTEPAENVTEPTDNVTKPIDNATKPIDNVTEPIKVETEPANNTTLIDLEPLKTFILNAPIDQVNDFILNSDELFTWLHGAGVYPDILQDRETLWGLIKDAVELGYLNLQVSMDFFPDPDEDPAGWVVGAGKNKDAGFEWDGCRHGIKEGYLTLKRYNEWLTPHDFLNLLLHIKDHAARQRFIYDLAVLETAPELADPATLKHLNRFKLDYPTPPPCKEEPISVVVDRITGRWGKECGLGDEERVDRVLTHLNANFKENPPDELSDEPDEDGSDDDDPPFLNLIFSPDCDDSDNEVTQARKTLKQVLLDLATAILPENWAEMPIDELRRHCKPLLKLIQEDAQLRELAIKAKWLERQP